LNAWLIDTLKRKAQKILGQDEKIGLGSGIGEWLIFERNFLMALERKLMKVTPSR
jgi:hypothetical protein